MDPTTSRQRHFCCPLFPARSDGFKDTIHEHNDHQAVQQGSSRSTIEPENRSVGSLAVQRLLGGFSTWFRFATSSEESSSKYSSLVIRITAEDIYANVLISWLSIPLDESSSSQSITILGILIGAVVIQYLGWSWISEANRQVRCVQCFPYFQLVCVTSLRLECA